GAGELAVRDDAEDARRQSGDEGRRRRRAEITGAALAERVVAPAVEIAAQRHGRALAQERDFTHRLVDAEDGRRDEHARRGVAGAERIAVVAPAEDVAARADRAGRRRPGRDGERVVDAGGKDRHVARRRRAVVEAPVVVGAGAGDAPVAQAEAGVLRAGGDL